MVAHFLWKVCYGGPRFHIVSHCYDSARFPFLQSGFLTGLVTPVLQTWTHKHLLDLDLELVGKHSALLAELMAI